jgi:hypothetical protein
VLTLQQGHNGRHIVHIATLQHKQPNKTQTKGSPVRQVEQPNTSSRVLARTAPKLSSLVHAHAVRLDAVTIQTPWLYLQEGLQEAPKLMHTKPAELGLVQPAVIPSNTH